MADTESEIETEPPANKTEHPAKKKRKKLHFTTWIALASAVAAVIAAYISASSVNVAKAQNIAAEQQQLVSITIAIEQAFDGERAAQNQAVVGLTGTAKSTALSEVDQGVVAETAAYAQAAAVLINNLHGNGVAGIEYVQVARALANYGNTALAISYYKDAVNASLFDVPTRADALRFEASLYYSLGQNSIGHQDMITAATIYNSHLELTKNLIYSSIAQAYLEDAGYQIIADDCKIAGTDMADAQRAVTPLGGITGSNVGDQALAGTVVAAYKKKCAA
jgi:hypothetical protein